jgi:hypothetical protein
MKRFTILKPEGQEIIECSDTTSMLLEHTDMPINSMCDIYKYMGFNDFQIDVELKKLNKLASAKKRGDLVN